jgi:hypothetical protein
MSRSCLDSCLFHTQNIKTADYQPQAPSTILQLAIMMNVPRHMDNFVTAMQQVYQFPMAVDDK